MLRKLEEALQAALERPFARVFPEAVHPLELAAELRRAMTDSRVVTEDATFVANRYRIALSLPDYGRLAEIIPTVERELAAHLAEFAAEGALVSGPDLQVRIEPADDLDKGRFRVAGGFAPPAEAYLEVVSGLPGRGTRFRLAESNVLGRSPTCDIHLDEATISRSHAEVSWRFVLYEVADLGSANGTFVNGQQVERAPLQSGDLIEVGLVQLRFLKG